MIEFEKNPSIQVHVHLKSKIGAVVKISFYFGYKIVNLKYNGLKFGHPKTIDPFLSKNKKLFIQHLRVRMSIVPV